MAAEQSYRSVLFKGALEGIRVSEIMTENPVTVDADLIIAANFVTGPVVEYVLDVSTVGSGQVILNPPGDKAYRDSGTFFIDFNCSNIVC